MYLQKGISRKTFFVNLFFVGILKVNDENSRIWIRIRIRIHYIRGMDLRIQIRIHTKMSWIRNTGRKGRLVRENRVFLSSEPRWCGVSEAGLLSRWTKKWLKIQGWKHCGFETSFDLKALGFEKSFGFERALVLKSALDLKALLHSAYRGSRCSLFTQLVTSLRRSKINTSE